MGHALFRRRVAAGADWLIRLAALLWIPTRTTPAAARSWLLLVGFLPLVGLPLYLLLGHPWLSGSGCGGRPWLRA